MTTIANAINNNCEKTYVSCWENNVNAQENNTTINAKTTRQQLPKQRENNYEHNTIILTKTIRQLLRKQHES